MTEVKCRLQTGNEWSGTELLPSLRQNTQEKTTRSKSPRQQWKGCPRLFSSRRPNGGSRVCRRTTKRIKFIAYNTVFMKKLTFRFIYSKKECPYWRCPSTPNFVQNDKRYSWESLNFGIFISKQPPW